MKWFNGSITEAVATSKAKKSIFVVFISGKDDASIQVSRSIESLEISSRLEQEDFVAVQIESGSETYRFFAQIYHLVPVPSIFFIGETGVPLEIVAGSASISELVEKIDNVLAKSGKIASGSAIHFTSLEQKTDTSESINVTIAKEDVCIPGIQEKSSGKSENISTKPSHEEEVKPVQQIMELRKKQCVDEEMKKELKKKVERKQNEYELQELRLKQRELEIKQCQEEMLKKKVADVTAKERVRQQIAQDREIRKEREQAFQKSASQPPEKQIKTQSSSSDGKPITRIQFRLPSGNTHMGQFEPSITLGMLRSYVIDNIELPFQQFTLSTSFPKRDLLLKDDDKTLVELELVPTSVILILPLKSSNTKMIITSSEDMGFLFRTLWSIFTPIVGVYNYIMHYFFRPNRSSDREQHELLGTSESTRITDENTSQNFSHVQASGLRRRNLMTEDTKVIKTQGNIHRLHSARDDNDENNTWNGNSTQQM